MVFFVSGSGDHRYLHVLTHPFPTRRSSDRDVADDGKAEAGAGLVAVEADAAVEDAVAVCGGDADAVVLDLDLGGRPVARDGDEHAAAAIFGRVLDRKSTRLNSSH